MTDETEGEAIAKALVYYRVSTEGQAKSGLGLEAQELQVKRYCAKRGLEIVLAYEDAGVSGATPLKRRPSAKNLMLSLEQSEGEEEPWSLHLVVWCIDRLWRHVPTAYAALAELQNLKVCVHFVKEGLVFGDGGDITAGERMASSIRLHLMLAISQHEREVTVERTIEALQAKKARGEHVGEVPFGFHVVNKYLRPFKPELVTLGLIWRMRFVLDYTQKETAKHLNLIHRKKRRNPYWTKRAVQIQEWNVRDDDELRGMACEAYDQWCEDKPKRRGIL